MAALGRLLGATGLGALALTPEESEAGFLGALARTADDFMLGVAKKMEAEGISRDEIWQKTGWGRGADNEWRFEIDDRAVQFPEGGEYGYLRDVPGTEQYLEAYPDIGDIKVSQGGSGGHYYPDEGGKGERLYYEDTSAGLHELGHGVQRREGFAVGGTPEQFTDAPAIIPENRLNTLLDKYGFSTEQIDEWLAIDNVRDPSPADRLYVARQYLEGSLAKPEDLAELQEISKTTFDRETAYDQYAKLAGEVEARNIQTRMGMTPQERRLNPPWYTEDIPRSGQIIRRESGYATPGILGALGAGTGGALGAGILAAPEATEGTISSPVHPNLFNAVNRARTFGQRLEGSPMSLLYPEGTVNWLGRLSMGQTPTWGERIGAAFDWL